MPYPVAACRGGHVVAAGAAGPSSAIVAGAGTAAANGTYTYRGMGEFGPYYNLVGQPDNPGLSALQSGEEGYWIIVNGAAQSIYKSVDLPPFPWNATGWSEIGTGTPPAPIVTEG